VAPPEQTAAAETAEYLHRLRELPFVRAAKLVNSAGGRPCERRILLKTPNREFQLALEFYSSRLNRDSTQLLAHRAERDLMVFTPVVPGELGDVLERAGINFVDLAGNCYLRLGERYVARIQGRRTPAVLKRLPSGGDRGLRAPAYRVLFGLLVEPNLMNASARAIAAAADVSPQTANDLRNWLLDKGFLVAARKHRHWAPGQRRRALTLWLSGYATTLAPSLLIGRFRARERESRELERRVELELDGLCDWRYGGAAAAWRLMQYYRGEQTLLYLRNPPKDIVSRLRLVADANGSVALLHSPGRPSFVSPESRCVHPLLAYADLLAEGDERANEAAAELYDRFIAQELEP
jgi:hypothetical protein